MYPKLFLLPLVPLALLTSAAPTRPETQEDVNPTATPTATFRTVWEGEAQGEIPSFEDAEKYTQQCQGHACVRDNELVDPVDDAPSSAAKDFYHDPVAMAKAREFLDKYNTMKDRYNYGVYKTTNDQIRKDDIDLNPRDIDGTITIDDEAFAEIRKQLADLYFALDPLDSIRISSRSDDRADPIHEMTSSMAAKVHARDHMDTVSDAASESNAQSALSTPVDTTSACFLPTPTCDESGCQRRARFCDPQGLYDMYQGNTEHDNPTAAVWTNSSSNASSPTPAPTEWKVPAEKREEEMVSTTARWTNAPSTASPTKYTPPTSWWIQHLPPWYFHKPAETKASSPKSRTDTVTTVARAIPTPPAGKRSLNSNANKEAESLRCVLIPGMDHDTCGNSIEPVDGKLAEGGSQSMHSRSPAHKEEKDAQLVIPCPDKHCDDPLRNQETSEPLAHRMAVQKRGHHTQTIWQNISPTSSSSTPTPSLTTLYDVDKRDHHTQTVWQNISPSSSSSTPTPSITFLYDVDKRDHTTHTIWQNISPSSSSPTPTPSLTTLYNVDKRDSDHDHPKYTVYEYMNR